MCRRWLMLLLALTACDRVFSQERETAPLGDWASVDGGARHTCAIKVDGTLWCWGDNAYGQLGVPGLFATRPVQVGEGTWRAVAAGGLFTCAISSDGSLWCWGDNTYGELGVGDYMRREAPAQVAAGPFVQVSASGTHACAVDQPGGVWCWGFNTSGQVGNGTTSRDVPVPSLVAGPGYVSVSAQGANTCAIKDDDTLWCWGQNAYYQLADPNRGTNETVSVPSQAPGAWRQVAVATYSTCALSTSGQVRCWGYNYSGQLGSGTTSASSLGVYVGSGASDWVSVVAGGEHMCGLRASGELSCWGGNARGQVPNPDAGEVASLPATIATVVDAWIEIGLGVNHGCLIDAGHRMWCYGHNADGQLGRGTGEHLTPQQVEGTWHGVVVGGGFTCALDADSEAFCWGEEGYDALGDGTGLARQSPTRILAPGPWDELVAGLRHVCARRGTSYTCWGSNEYGQFGDGTIRSAPLTRPITSGLWATTATTHACSIEGGRMRCWGANANGQTGQPASATPVTSPASVGSDTTWRLVVAGGTHTCGVNATGVQCWGKNANGQLGSQVGTDSATPLLVNVPNGATAEALAMGAYHSCAIVGGMATCWGYNFYGELGIGTINGTSTSPTTLQGMWRQIDIGTNHSCGVGMDGTLWCWGLAEEGRLGDGSLVPHARPSQVGSDAGWERVVVGTHHACATKIGGELWCWGRNDSGQLGTNTAWSRELVQVE